MGYPTLSSVRLLRVLPKMKLELVRNDIKPSLDCGAKLHSDLQVRVGEVDLNSTCHPNLYDVLDCGAKPQFLDRNSSRIDV
jgi:hypothetical protein